MSKTKLKSNPAEFSSSSNLASRQNISAEHISDRFVEISNKLSEMISINRSVLILNQRETNQLAAVSTWEKGAVRDGLTITLPSESSLLQKVANEGVAHTIENPNDFSGNFFEKKLLLNNESKSLIIQPLIEDDEVIGLLSLSSVSGELNNKKSQLIIQEATRQLASLISMRNKKQVTV